MRSLVDEKKPGRIDSFLFKITVLICLGLLLGPKHKWMTKTTPHMANERVIVWQKASGGKFCGMAVHLGDPKQDYPGGLWQVWAVDQPAAEGLINLPTKQSAFAFMGQYCKTGYIFN